MCSLSQVKITITFSVYLSKRFAWTLILEDATADTIAVALYELCLSLALVPSEIQSDNGRQFVSTVVT